jgi:hypothetical protein
MAEFWIHEDIEQEQLLESDSDKGVSSNSDKDIETDMDNTNSGHNGDSASAT